jgi:putative peptidoglycan lipid II flippase
VLARAQPGAARAYPGIWQRDARWSLLGVLTTEMTVNSHSYLVTGWYGPRAFAPIAATALLIRPMTVAINALVEFERARFAGDLAASRWHDVRRARRHLHQMLLTVWTVSLAGGAGLLLLAPGVLFHGKFSGQTLWLGTGLWFAIVLARGLHAPEGAVLQAAGEFRQLARISCWTAVLSIVVAVIMLAAIGPLWSLAGIAIGEGAYAIALHRASARYFRAPPMAGSSTGAAR